MKQKDNSKILSNKNCLVTGATGGLGIEICRILLEKECNIFLTSTNKLKLKNTEIELSKNFKGSKIFSHETDLRKTDQITKLIDTVKKEMGTVEIIINCAGIFSSKSIDNTTLNEFEDIFNVNVKAPFLLAKNFIGEMKKRRWGRIVNIGSSSSYSGFKNSIAYCTSKHGVLGLSRSLFEEVKSDNIRVFSFSPGSIKTNMGKQVKNQNFDTFLDPKEIASFIIFTISFDSQLITSENQIRRLNPE